MNRRFTDVQDLLLDCLRCALTAEQIASTPHGIDWLQFVEIARREGVLHLLLGADSVVSTLPADVLNVARRERVLVAQRNLLLATELIRVIERFNSARLEVKAFKGVVAAIQFHGDLATRASGDLDLLVRTREYHRAAELLLSAGYQLSVDHPDSLQGAFWNPTNQITIDLHWGMPPKGSGFSHRELWRYRSTVDLLGKPVPTFDAAAAIAVTAINAVKGYWDVSLRHLVDVFLSVKGLSENEAEQVLRRCHRIGCTNFLLAAVHICDQLFGTVPQPFAQAVGRTDRARAISDEILQHLFEHSPGATQTRVFASRQEYENALDERKFGKLRDRVRSALTPNAVDKSWLALPDHLHFLYYVVRPFRLLRYGRHRATPSDENDHQ